MIPVLEISKAGLDDLDDLVFLSEAGDILSYGTRADIINMLDDPNRVVLVCRQEGEIVATTALHVDKTEPIRIRQGDKLVLKPYHGSWTSGTITHPNHLKKGYAISLILSRFHYLSFYGPQVKKFFSAITGQREYFADDIEHIRKTRPDIKIEKEDYETFVAVVRRHGMDILAPEVPFERYKDIYGFSRSESKGAEICLKECGMKAIGVSSSTMGPAFEKDVERAGTLAKVEVDDKLGSSEVAFALSSELVVLGNESPDTKPLMTYAELISSESKEKLRVSPAVYKLFGSPEKLWVGATKLRHEDGRFTAKSVRRTDA